MFQIKIPNELGPFISRQKRFKIMIGGRGGAKSETTAAMHAAMVHNRGCRDVCCREFQTSIKQSVHSLMARKIAQLELDGFEVLDTEIRHKNGGQIIYQGLSRDPQAIKSVDDAELAWAEEAQSLSHESLKELTPSIRGEDAEIWFTANLRNSKDPFSQRFIKPFEKQLRKDKWYEDELHMIAWINYDKNPWFPKELEMERQHDKETLTTAEYDHKWEGDFNDSVDNAIILPAWFDACVDAHLKLGIEPRGVEVISHDPSDTGFDNKGLAYRHGILIKDVLEEAHGDINEGGDWAIDYALAKRPHYFLWDCDGMGVGLRRQFVEATKNTGIQVAPFHGSMSVDEPDGYYERAEKDSGVPNKKNKDSFRNKRAQYYWHLRDRCWKTYRAVVHKEYKDPLELISFSSDIGALDLLRNEICTVPKKHNPLGLFQVLSKEEMRKQNIDSPNMADSVMMSLAIPMKKRVHKRIKRRLIRNG